MAEVAAGSTRVSRPMSRMALTLCLWFCTVPFVALVVGAWLGLKAALVAVLATLVVAAAVCRTLCAVVRPARRAASATR